MIQGIGKRITVLSGCVFFILLAVLTALVYQQYRLQGELSDLENACKKELSQLEGGYKDELNMLQQKLLSKHDTDVGDSVRESPTENGSGQHEKLLVAAVDRKYRFLLSRIKLSEEDRQTLYTLLLERRRIEVIKEQAHEKESVARVTNIAQLDLEMSGIDDQVRQLLDPESIERYDLLKDSLSEQQYLQQYQAGITDTSLLFDAKQEEAVLFARLRHKQDYEKALQNSALYSDYPLTDAQRLELYRVVEDALNKYKNGFLMDVFPVLDGGEEQFLSLANYENEKFVEELERLKGMIDRRSIPQG